MITDVQITTNYARWLKRLEKYKCFSQKMIDEIGDKIRTATWAMNAESGAAYQGSLLNVVMNHLCDLAYSFNEVALTNTKTNTISHPFIKVSTDMLIRVLLLQHISKAELFIPQTETWKIKRGMLYTYNPDIETTLKIGERSLFLCQKYGIYLSEDEYDALRAIDKMDDASIGQYQTPLALMVKMANQFASMEMRRQWDYVNKTKIQQLEQ